MIRNSFYTTYQDKQYRLGKHDDTSVNLISPNFEDEKNGFVKFTSDPDLYKKTIFKDEVEAIYSIHTFGIYKGLKFPIDMERDDQYMLSTNKAEIAEKLDFYNINKSEFEKWVDKKDIEHIYEIKELIPDFFD